MFLDKDCQAVVLLVGAVDRFVTPSAIIILDFVNSKKMQMHIFLNCDRERYEFGFSQESVLKVLMGKICWLLPLL